MKSDTKKSGSDQYFVTFFMSRTSNPRMTTLKPKPVAGKLRVISLFTCGMGMDIGFEKAGFSTVYTNDIAKFACETIRKNKPRLHCDEGDIAGNTVRTDSGEGRG